MTDLQCPVPRELWEEPDREEPTAYLRWPLDFACCSGVDWSANSGLQEFVSAAAIEALWAKTGRRYSVCVEDVYPPCNDHVHVAACSPIARCDWRSYDIGRLFDQPLISINSVTVDGEDVPAEDNWYVRRGLLIPIRDGLLWLTPAQDANVVPGGPGTWSINVSIGEMPPPLLLIAGADLACQLAKYCLGQPCDVPANAISVTRDGVTISLETGLKGLPTVKMALEAYPAVAKKRISRLTDPSDWAGVGRSL